MDEQTRAGKGSRSIVILSDGELTLSSSEEGGSQDKDRRWGGD